MDWNDLLGQVISALLPIVASLLVAGIAWLGKRTDAWLEARIQNEYLEGASRRLNEATWTVVLELQQTHVDALKAATDESGPGGRKITSDEAENLKKLAVGKLKSYLGPKGLAILMKVLGLDEGGLNELLRANIESVVRTNKDALETAALNGGKARPFTPPSEFGAILQEGETK